MPAQQQDKPPANRATPDGQQLSARIGQLVLHALGQPDDLNRVQVRRLWEDRYRVNVLVGTDAVSTRVAHSYFVVMDDDGTIRATTPRITRQY